MMTGAGDDFVTTGAGDFEMTGAVKGAGDGAGGGGATGETTAEVIIRRGVGGGKGAASDVTGVLTVR